MRLARDKGVIVLVDGQGADELLGGYEHFFRPFLEGLWRRSGEDAAQRQYVRLRNFYAVDPLSWKEKLHALVPALWSTAARLSRAGRLSGEPAFISPAWHAAEGRAGPPFRRFACLDDALRFFTLDHGLKTLLRYSDRSSMAFGREVRLPFLSHELVNFTFSLPESAKLWDGETKRVLRHSMRGVVPDEILDRRDKLGFEPPEAQWLENPAVDALVRAGHETLVREGVAVGDCPQGSRDRWKVLMGAATFDFVRRCAVAS
jgi:asparagine synthase (glutamine-hydrolysing)